MTIGNNNNNNFQNLSNLQGNIRLSDDELSFIDEFEIIDAKMELNDLPDLKSYFEELGIVANLEKGQRLSQDSKNKISNIYTSADNYKISKPTKRLVDNTFRRLWGDSTAGACNRVQQIVDEILKVSDQKVSKASYSSFKTLLPILQQCNEKGLKNLSSTVSSSEQYLVNQVNSQNKVNCVTETIDKVNDLANTIIDKITTYEQENHDAEFGELTNTLKSLYELSESVPASYGHYQKNVVVEFLEQTFGKDLTKDVLSMYGMQDKLVITPNEFKSLLAGSIANITLKDVQYILNNQGSELYNVLEEKGKLPAANNNNNNNNPSMAEEDLFKIVKSLRKVKFDGLLKQMEYQDCYYQLSGDISLIDSCCSAEQYNFLKSNHPDSPIHELKKLFGYHEHLTRDYCYSLFETEFHQFREGSLLISFDEEGNKVCREAHNLFAKDYIFLLGVSPVKDISETQDSVELVFRGTYDLGSLKRDLSLKEKRYWYGWEAPGPKSFARNQDTIMQNAEKFIGDRSKLHISGHSLGGTDVSRFKKVLLENLVEGRFFSLKEVTCPTYNAPGYETDYAHSVSENLQMEQLNHITFNTPSFTTEGDIVHKFCDHYIGYLENDVIDLPNVNRISIRFGFFGNLTSGSSVSDEAYKNGSVSAASEAVVTSVKWKINAHSLSYFKESTTDKIYVHFGCATGSYEKLLDKVDKDRVIDKSLINDVLTQGFKFVVKK